ncbi:TIGR02679 family protein [Pengzhenrongella frigida]|uniref:TIGR02679 family protein n=1 Tax=Pengzhenrongella frigida TaxID=1259133 RepID=UPI0013EB1125|nr:TIGR02679 family protein [Cellulomonas sp. HLT2-17]
MTPSAVQPVVSSATAPPGADVTALRRLLGGADVAWLVQRVRGKIATGHTGRLSGTVQLRKPTPDERDGAVRLVGPPSRLSRSSSTLHVNLGTLDDLLVQGIWPRGLADAVLVLTGPVATWPRERAVVDAAWVHAAAAFTPALLVDPVLETWWGAWCASGHLRRAGLDDPVAARRLAADAAACLCALPTTGEPLAVFARRITGDAHALDRTRPLSGLVLAAVHALELGSPAHGHAAAQPEARAHGLAAAQPDAAVAEELPASRGIWASAGLLPSIASATVLCLGVQGDPFARRRGLLAASATAAALTGWCTAGVPVALTLDQIRSGGVGVVPSDGVVHVCTSAIVMEAVAAEATRRADLAASTLSGDRATPILVCTDGPPGAAALELLERLSWAGAEVRFHGDFDWEGLQIGVALAERIPWAPWRFGTMDYAQAVAALAAGELSEATVDRRHLGRRGESVTSPWDPALAEAMERCGEVIEESEVVDWLVTDLLDPVRLEPVSPAPALPPEPARPDPDDVAGELRDEIDGEVRDGVDGETRPAAP